MKRGEEQITLISVGAHDGFGFTVIPNDAIRDSRHTLTSAGLLIWLLSMSQAGAPITEDDIRRRIGHDADAAMEHLQRLGYLDLGRNHITIRDTPRGGSK